MTLEPSYWLRLAEAADLKQKPGHWFRLRANLDYEDFCTGEVALSGAGFEVRSRQAGETIRLRTGSEHLEGRYDLLAMWPGTATAHKNHGFDPNTPRNRCVKCAKKLHKRSSHSAIPVRFRLRTEVRTDVSQVRSTAADFETATKGIASRSASEAPQQLAFDAVNCLPPLVAARPRGTSPVQLRSRVLTQLLAPRRAPRFGRLAITHFDALHREERRDDGDQDRRGPQRTDLCHKCIRERHRERRSHGASATAADMQVT